MINMKITESQLRQLIKEVLKEEAELSEASMEQAKVQGPLRDLYTSLQTAKKQLGREGAKRAVSELMQNTSESEKAQQLLKAITQIESNIDSVMNWLNSTSASSMTKDPWAGVGKRS